MKRRMIDHIIMADRMQINKSALPRLSSYTFKHMSYHNLKNFLGKGIINIEIISVC